MIKNKPRKGENSLAPRPRKPLHSVENWSPLSRSNIRSHVFVEASVWSTVEAANIKSLLDSEFVFEAGFAFSTGIAEYLGAFNGAIAAFHVLCKSRVRPFVGSCGFHVLLVACFEVACGFAYVFFVAWFTCVLIDTFLF